MYSNEVCVVDLLVQTCWWLGKHTTSSQLMIILFFVFNPPMTLLFSFIFGEKHWHERDMLWLPPAGPWSGPGTEHTPSSLPLTGIQPKIFGLPADTLTAESHGPGSWLSFKSSLPHSLEVFCYTFRYIYDSGHTTISVLFLNTHIILENIPLCISVFWLG